MALSRVRCRVQDFLSNRELSSHATLPSELSYWDKATEKWELSTIDYVVKLLLKNLVQVTILYTVPDSTDHPLIYKTHHRDCTNNNQHGE